MSPICHPIINSGYSSGTQDSVPIPSGGGKNVERFLSDGGEFIHESVQNIKPGEQENITLKLENREIQSERVLVAAGAWSHQLASQLGVKIPLETERGYHVTLNSKEGGPQNIVMESAHKFMATPMEMESVLPEQQNSQVSNPANQTRAEILLKLGKRCIPNLKMEKAPTGWDTARAFRIRPVIDFCPNNKKIIFAFGHGHRD